MDILDKYKLELLERVLEIIGVKLRDVPVAIPVNIFNDVDIKQKLQEIVPILKKFYRSDKLTALHCKAFETQVNPSLNLIRQILKENDYEIKSRTSKNGLKQYVIRKQGDIVGKNIPVVLQIKPKKSKLVLKTKQKSA